MFIVQLDRSTGPMRTPTRSGPAAILRRRASQVPRAPNGGPSNAVRLLRTVDASAARHIQALVGHSETPRRGAMPYVDYVAQRAMVRQSVTAWRGC